MKLICVGEVLIDMLSGKAAPEAKVPALAPFQPHAGGAPANVAVACARLGGQSQLISRVGDDNFGHYLIQSLNHYGVNTGQVSISDKAKTALAFVSLDSDGERSFDFYLENAAHTELGEAILSRVAVSNESVVHFCSGSLSTPMLKQGMVALLQRCKQSYALTSLDINFRPAFWEQPEEAARAIDEVIRYVDVVKTSLEELHALYGESQADRCISQWLESGVSWVLLTDGANPVRFISQDEQGSVSAPATQVKDTTAAGDAFIGGFLYSLTTANQNSVEARNWLTCKKTLAHAVEFAARCGAYTVSQFGAFSALPTQSDVIVNCKH